MSDFEKLINASDLIDWIIETDPEWCIGTVRSIVDHIEDMPSASPERKEGHWVKMSDADGVYYCCSECGEPLYRTWSFDRDFDLFPKLESIEKTNCCPNCGVKMAAARGESDGRT